MSSKNWQQKFVTNPITTNQADDLLYWARSPYGNTNDAVINWQNFSAQFAGNVLTTKGDLYTFSTVNARLAVGTTNGQILQVNSAAATGLGWSTPTYPSASGTAGKIIRSDGTNNIYSTSTFADTYAINSIPYASAANTITALAPALSSVLVSSAASTGVPVWSGALTNGQLIIGSTGATPVVATVGSSGNISLSVGAGSLSIGTSGAANFSRSNVTGAAQTIVADTAYTSNNAGSSVAYTMPATAAVGTVIEIIGSCSGGWNIIQLANQIIHVGASPTTTGVGGSITTTNRYNCLRLACIVANLEWSATSVQGNLTIV